MGEVSHDGRRQPTRIRRATAQYRGDQRVQVSRLMVPPRTQLTTMPVPPGGYTSRRPRPRRLGTVKLA